MKKSLTILTALVFSLVLITGNNSFAGDKDLKCIGCVIEKTDWKAFSKNLVKALKSENPGLQTSAMQFVIKHGTQVNVDRAILDIVRLYRINKDEKVRQLALVTIHATQNQFALDIVKRDLLLENNPKIKKTMLAILNDKPVNSTRKIFHFHTSSQ